MAVTSSVTAKEVWDAVEAGKPVFVRGIVDGDVVFMGPAVVTLESYNNDRVVHVTIVTTNSTMSLYALYPDETFSDEASADK